MAQDNKTEKPTPRRRQKAREKGQVARSRDLVAGLATMAVVLGLATQAPAFAAEWRALLRHTLNAAVNSELVLEQPLGGGSSLGIFRGTALVLALSWGLAALAAVAQGGLVVAPSALVPNLGRLSPARRLRQLFSLSALSRLLKSLLPAAVVVYLGVALLAQEWPAILALPQRALGGVLQFTLGHVFALAWKSALVLLIWAGVDYLLEHRKLESELRMSRQELRDEFKETEGHPTVKARIRRLQRQVRRRRMLKNVERAAVVITNPGEFAVALEYRPEMAAPVVVAKGRNLLAAQIKQVARWRGIPLIENPALAHALYRAVEIGQAIPPKLYTVVAGILAAIFRAQARAAAAGGEN